MVQTGQDDLLNRKKREIVERIISGVARGLRTKNDDDHNDNDEGQDQTSHELIAQVTALEGIQYVAQEYDQIGQIRNDLLHAGKNKNAMSASRLEKKILTLEQRLDKIRLGDGSDAS